MKKVAIYPYKISSESATLLADMLDVYKVYPDRKFQPTVNHCVINWGNGNEPTWNGTHFEFINKPAAVRNAINKVTALRLMRRAKVQIPMFTADVDVAHQWMDQGDWVVCRGKLEGMDGAGLTLAKTEDQIIPAKMYTRYIHMQAEFRSIVWMGQLLTVYQKKRQNGQAEKADPDIHTGSRGWCFCRDPQKVPNDIGEQSVKAISALGLDFGGCDVVWGKDNKSYILEVNTAPEIGKYTAELLKEAITSHIRGS